MSSRIQHGSGGGDRYDTPVATLAILGLVSGSVALGYSYANPEPILPWAIEFVIGVTPAVVLLYSALWLTRHRPLEDDRKQLTRSAIVGAATLGVLAALYAGHEFLTNGLDPDLLVLVSSSAAAGAVVALAAALRESPTYHLEFDEPVVDDASPKNAREPAGFDTDGSETAVVGAVLADPYLTILVEALGEPGDGLSRDQLARRIADETELSTRRARIKLHHTTLPKAEDLELAIADPDADRIVPDRYHEHVLESVAG